MPNWTIIFFSIIAIAIFISLFASFVYRAVYKKDEIFSPGEPVFLAETKDARKLSADELLKYLDLVRKNNHHTLEQVHIFPFIETYGKKTVYGYRCYYPFLSVFSKSVSYILGSIEKEDFTEDHEKKILIVLRKKLETFPNT